MRRALASVALSLGLLAWSTAAHAAQEPRATLVEVTKVSQPTDIASRASDPGLYITQQDGLVVRFDTTTKTKTTALDLTDFTEASGERGLLGIVFHPDGRFVYVNYTDAAGDTVVARYRMRTNGTAITTSRVVLFTLDQPYANHNGGGLAFGPNGRLYIGTGDGGSGVTRNAGHSTARRCSAKSSASTQWHATKRLPHHASGRSDCATRGDSNSTTT